MIGSTLNKRYRIDSEIGQGGMGTVYRGYDKALERQVAIKVLSRSGLGTEGRGELLSEAQTAAKLNHPNIVTIYDVGEEETTPYIVMEYVQGKSLHEQHPDTLEATLEILSQVCAGLEHAHSQGIIHRDLKPENVVITQEGTAKLMDFGLARSVASRYTTEGTVAGTVFYLAPEQALGQELDTRTDLYSLGVMAYELVTGELPFVDRGPIAVISQHLHAPVVPPRAKNEQISPLLNDLIVGLLSKDPQDRPTSVNEVIQALESPEILDLRAVPAREYSVLERIVRGRIVGRGKELNEARKLWHQARSEEGQLLLISGEPGIGKTRLVREIVTEAEVSGGKVLSGASYAEGGSPYGAFQQVIRQELSSNEHTLPGNTLTELLTLTPDLRQRYPDLPEPDAADPQNEQRRLLESMVTLCSSLSEREPLLLVLEDAHWADSGTLAMLRHLARNTRQLRVMIIATYREVEVDEARPFHEALLDLDRERLATRIKLRRLNQDQTREMLAILFAEGITPEFLESIYLETEGNPFFIEEVCKALVDSGRLYYQDGQWQRPSIEQLGIPQSLRVAIQSRVVRMPEQHQETLQLAAILGREFDFETLRRASELEEDILIDALDNAERALLIEEKSADGGEKFAFAHALIPVTLTESLRMINRRKLHRQAATAIEDQRPDDFEALAYHNIHAGRAEKGVGYLLKAGDRARSLYAHQEAIDHYEQGIEVLKEINNYEETARTLMKLGLTYHNAFEFEKSRRAYEQAFIQWQQAGISTDRLAPAPHPLRLVYDEPPTLDPGRCTDLFSASIIYQLFSGLVELSTEMSVTPDIAHSWEVLEGGRKYVFHLRNDVYWSDGVQVTASDFEYAWKRVLDPESDPYSASLLADIKNATNFYLGKLNDPSQIGVQAIDDLTLVVELQEPASYFLQLLTYLVTFPVPRHVVDGRGETWTEIGNLVTNGPYQLTEWNESNSALFNHNASYHGFYSGNLEQVRVLFDPEQKENLLQLYEQEVLDVIGLRYLEAVDAERARQKYAEEYVSGPQLNSFYIDFDTSQPPLDDKRIRRALALATSRERLASIALQGFMFPATGGLVPPGMPGHSPDIALPYDPGQARSLMAEAGYPDGKGLQELACLAPDTTFSRTTTNHLKSQWLQNLGIEIKLKFVEFGEYLDLRPLKTQVVYFAGFLLDYPDPDAVFRVEDVFRFTGWQNETFYELVEEARRMNDQHTRIELYQKAERIVVEEVPVIPLLYGRFHLLVKPWVKNINLSAINPLFWKDIILDPH